MININEKECVQIKEVLNKFNQEDRNKIPNEIILKINEGAMNTNYQFYIKDEIGIEKQISRNSLIFIIGIVTRYIANEQEKAKMKKILIKNKQLTEMTQNEYKNLFKKSELPRQENNCGTAMVVYKKTNGILEIINKLKKWVVNNFLNNNKE